MYFDDVHNGISFLFGCIQDPLIGMSVMAEYDDRKELYSIIHNAIYTHDRAVVGYIAVYCKIVELVLYGDAPDEFQGLSPIEILKLYIKKDQKIFWTLYNMM